LEGVRKSIADVLNNGQSPKYRGEDLRDGIVGVLHARVLQPQFQGQTKERLENTDIEQSIYKTVLRYLQKYVIENTNVSKSILDHAKKLRDAKQAFRAAQKAIKGTKVKKGARGLLPGKLTEAPDCTPQERELFLVEGDGAGGTVIKARVTKKGNRHYQEVFPLRGKLLNTARKGGIEDLVNNKEIQNLFKAIGTGVGDRFDLAKCRYNEVFFLMDADPDGKHIISLLLALFAKHLPELIQEDILRIVDNPLFMGVSAKQRCYGATITEVRQQFGQGEKIQIRRFKGLGESNPEDLRIYAMDPKTRKVIRVLWGGDQDAELVLEYMGRDTTARKEILGVIE
jgi:DNA gyrase subunit B